MNAGSGDIEHFVAQRARPPGTVTDNRSHAPRASTPRGSASLGSVTSSYKGLPTRPARKSISPGQQHAPSNYPHRPNPAMPSP
jgi:hypothetical protein